MTHREVAQGFDRYIDADLVAVHEAVDHGLGGRVDANPDTLLEVRFDPLGEDLTREARYPEIRIIESEFAGLLGQRDP